MEGIYDIRCGGKNVGTAKVSREGLYYRLDCECQADHKEIFKIVVSCGDEKMVLGTPIPEGQIFRLCTRLPAKRFSGQELRFSTDVHQEKFIPVYPDAPFAHLKDLKNAVFCIRDGVSGIVIGK